MKLLARNFSYREIGDHLNLTERSVRTYTDEIAKRIDGDLPAKARVIVWFRLHSGLDIFTGTPLNGTG